MLRPRTSMYHRIELVRSENTIATVSSPWIATTSPQGHQRTALESAPGARSLLRRTAAVHFGVPFHHFMVGDPLDLFFDREFVLRLPGLVDPAARGIALALGVHVLLLLSAVL